MSQISQDRSFSGKENITRIRGIEAILRRKLTEYCTERQFEVVAESSDSPEWTPVPHLLCDLGQAT